MEKKMWTYMLGLSSNMWGDPGSTNKYSPYYDTFATDEETWDNVIDFLPKQGINTVLIDVGDGIEFESHPEINLPGAWSKEKMETKLDRIRSLGMTPIPKLNFSTCHDAWMKEYSMMVSTPAYRQVCRDLIDEVSELFNKPEFFHLGLDEEGEACQRSFSYAVIRRGDLYWNDVYDLFDQVEKNGARPWAWADMVWHHQEEFYARMPKSVLLSNWWYHPMKKLPNGRYENDSVNAYLDLDAAGYDQVLTGSSWGHAKSNEETVQLGKNEISEEHLYGFMTAPWYNTFREDYYALLNEAWRFGFAKRKFYPDGE